MALMNRRQLISSAMGAAAATIVPAETVRDFHPGNIGAKAPELRVATAAQLTAALRAAVDDQVIVLAPGRYGNYTISRRNFGGYVTLRSQLPKGAVFESFSVLNSGRLRIDGILVSSPSNGSASSTIATIKGSHHIDFLNSEVNGLVDNNYSGHYGLYVLNCRDIVIRNNYVHDCRDGIVGFDVARLTVAENLVDYLESDGFKFAGLDDFLIENNSSGGHIFPNSDSHVDFVQFQGSSSNGIIRGNVYLPKTSAVAQGLFIADGVYTNITVEQNIIYTGMGNGIVIQGSNNIVRNNTVLNAPGLVHDGTWIQIIGPASYSKNIQTNVASLARITPNDIIAQHTNPNVPAYYSKLFVNARKGLGITLEDLRPVLGSPADFGTGMGAEQRLYQLLNP